MMKTTLDRTTMDALLLCLDAVAVELLGDYLASLPGDKRKIVLARVEARRKNLSDQVVALAPLALRARASEQAAEGERILGEIVAEAGTLAEPPDPKLPTVDLNG